MTEVDALIVALRYIVSENDKNGVIPNGWIRNIAKAADELERLANLTKAVRRG
jgi:hypothetical protein